MAVPANTIQVVLSMEFDTKKEEINTVMMKVNALQILQNTFYVTCVICVLKTVQNTSVQYKKTSVSRVVFQIK